MGVMKNMLEDIEMENYLDAQNGDYEDSPVVDDFDEKFSRYYDRNEDRDIEVEEFPGYDPNKVPKFTNVPTLGGCLSYLLFSGAILLIFYLIFGNL